jgi:hypothetical protein
VTITELLKRAENQTKAAGFPDIIRFDPLLIKPLDPMQPLSYVDAVGVDGEKAGQVHCEEGVTKWVDLKDYEFPT